MILQGIINGQTTEPAAKSWGFFQKQPALTVYEHIM